MEKYICFEGGNHHSLSKPYQINKNQSKIYQKGIWDYYNVLWSGKVTRPTSKNDIETKALKTFNEKVHSDSRVNNVLMPVRDGMMIMIKK